MARLTKSAVFIRVVLVGVVLFVSLAHQVIAGHLVDASRSVSVSQGSLRGIVTLTNNFQSIQSKYTWYSTYIVSVAFIL